MDAKWTWAVLMAYGIGMTLGNGAGGAMADRNMDGAILIALTCMLGLAVAFYFAAHNAWTGALVFGVLAFFGSVLVPSLQLRLMEVAGDAQALASALNQSALNIANAMGAAIGGIVVGAGFSYNSTALAGAALALVGVSLWFVTMWDKRRIMRRNPEAFAPKVKIVEQS